MTLKTEEKEGVFAYTCLHVVFACAFSAAFTWEARGGSSKEGQGEGQTC